MGPSLPGAGPGGAAGPGPPTQISSAMMLRRTHLRFHSLVLDGAEIHPLRGAP